MASLLTACNVYVSTSEKDLLLRLLRRAQRNCSDRFGITNAPAAAATATTATNGRGPQSGITDDDVAVVHVFSDTVYERSSFHLAGSALNVAAVASDLAVTAIHELQQQQQQHRGEVAAGNQTRFDDNTNNNNVHHPYVGLVDHIAVMPLSHDVSSTVTSETAIAAAGRAARMIGKALEEHGIPRRSPAMKVYYYGAAHPDGMPLATVRRERTSFFRSGGLAENNGSAGNDDVVDVCTVGAPEAGFVENFNIRLTSACDQRRARSLTKHVRERDGGLLGVEALTLPYSNNRWEVACNLLSPNIASAHDIDQAVAVWVAEQQKQGDASSATELIEKSYRVGTTEAQCLDVLSHSTLEERRRHDHNVIKRLKSYFL